MCLVGSYFCCSLKASTLCNTLGVMWRLSRKCTLHIGATKIAPFQSCGSLRWISKATAPPIESPYKNLALFMYSSLSAIQHDPPISINNRRWIFLAHVYCCWLSTTIWQIGTSTYIPSSHPNLYIKHDAVGYLQPQMQISIFHELDVGVAFYRIDNNTTVLVFLVRKISLSLRRIHNSNLQ